MNSKFLNRRQFTATSGSALAVAALTSPPALSAEAKPDIVAIAPRHVDHHHDICLAAMAAGARGLCIEKPFCRSPREADEIVAACAEKNVKLAVACIASHPAAGEDLIEAGVKSHLAAPLAAKGRDELAAALAARIPDGVGDRAAG